MSTAAAKFSAAEIARVRLQSLLLAPLTARSPVEVVTWFGALQAQDYASALTAVALRAGSTRAAVEEAIAQRQIVRTWPMRGTLHFVPAVDVRWMLRLLTPRVLRTMEKRQGQLGLDRAAFDRTAQLFARELAQRPPRPRAELFALMEAAGLPSGGGRGYHTLCRLTQEEVICQTTYAKREPAYALADEWLPPSRELTPAAALAEIARRYFRAHGPATVQDFAWWTGLTAKEARAGVEAVAPEFAEIEFAGRAHWLSPALLETTPPAIPALLLPAFDEHLLGYQDRTAVLAPEHAAKVVPGKNGMFLPTLVVDGQVVGLWKRGTTKKAPPIEFLPFTKLPASAQRALKQAAAALSA